MPGLGTSKPKKKKPTMGDFAGRILKPKDALIDQLRTPTLDMRQARPKRQGIISEDGKTLSYVRESEA